LGDPVPYRQELARLNILTSVLFTYIWSYLHFFQLRSQTTKPRHRERMRKLNKSLIYAFKNPMSGTYPGLVFWQFKIVVSYILAWVPGT
jgi:hypothetical protein